MNISKALCTTVLGLSLALVVPGTSNAEDSDGSSDESPEVRSHFFDAIATTLKGTWKGRYTNGTFDEPGEWMPIRVDYRLTSAGSALVEDYIYGTDESKLGMTTVYHKDRNELRLTHYCGAMNHPSMIAREIDLERNLAKFEFTGITNHQNPSDYHSRNLELEIVDRDSVRITYHGVKEGVVYSQAYDLTRYDTAATSD